MTTDAITADQSRLSALVERAVRGPKTAPNHPPEDSMFRARHLGEHDLSVSVQRHLVAEVVGKDLTRQTVSNRIQVHVRIKIQPIVGSGGRTL